MKEGGEGGEGVSEDMYIYIYACMPVQCTCNYMQLHT